MVKESINKNFEKMKAEMIKKKEISKVKEENVDECEVVDKSLNVNVNEHVNKNGNKDEYKDTGINENKIVIKKAQKPQPPKRITYYLNNETIKKIDKYSKLTGMGKSELVQTLLDISLNNLEIES